MKLFNAMFGNRYYEIGSPMDGECVEVKQVNDPTFQEELLGSGIAIYPSNGRVCAPNDGSVEMVFHTGHAISMLTSDGIELLIHIGIDTVELQGKYFQTIVKQGDRVKKGDLLIIADIEGIRSEGYDVVTPVVITNSSNFTKIIRKTGMVTVGDTIINVGK